MATKKENASTIAKTNLNQFQNLKNFLEILVKDVDIETKQVGRKFRYPISIEKNKMQSNYGTFMDYFIRKLLSDQFQINIRDEFAELVINNPDVYFTGRLKNGSLLNDIKKHYLIFKDSRIKALNMLNSIKITSLSYKLTFHDPLPKAECESNNDNLLEIIKYFGKLPYSEVEMKANVDCEYFEGTADLIFDRKVLYEIKTSKFESPSRFDEKFHVKNFYKLILYGFGYYKKTGKIIKCFKIYNPLLGIDYAMHINDIDMKHFEKVLKHDLTK